LIAHTWKRIGAKKRGLMIQAAAAMPFFSFR